MSNNKPQSAPSDPSSSNTNPPIKPPRLRVERVHGGWNVEEIEKPEAINEPGCPHTNMTRDFTEKDFIAFVCDNPKCGIVKLFNKPNEEDK